VTDPRGLRIGLEVSKVAGISDGIGRYAKSLLRSLRALNEDHELVLFDLADDHLGGRASVDLRVVTESGGSGDPVPLDVFHSTGFALPPVGNVPLVMTVHDLTFLTHPRVHTVENWGRAVSTAADAADRGATFIAVSKHTRDEVVGLLGVSTDRVTVVHEAPDSVFRPGEAGSAGVLEGFDLQGDFVLAVGSLEPRKNLIGLLDGMLQLPRSVADRVTLVVVGPHGWRNRSIRERVDRARRTLRVKEVGYVSTEELVELYRRAAIFAYPSLSEGFGLPVLEAMACGAPVLTSNRSSLPEVAGDAAVLVDPDDPADIALGLERMLSDRGLRSGMIEKGFDNVRRFSWDRCARETVAVYRRAIGGGEHGCPS
jgi:glycosyltransferase involved in cell wall biosynthesis